MIDEEIWQANLEEFDADLYARKRLQELEEMPEFKELRESKEPEEKRVFISPCCLEAVSLEKPSVIRCPRCGESFPTEFVESFMNITLWAVHYGWMYRKHYEHAKEEYDKLEYAPKPCLAPPEEVLLIIGGLVVTSIIGGLAYDGFKKLIGKLSKEKKNEKLRKQLEKMTPEELTEFYDYVKEFYDKIFEKGETKKGKKKTRRKKSPRTASKGKT